MAEEVKAKTTKPKAEKVAEEVKAVEEVKEVVEVIEVPGVQELE